MASCLCRICDCLLRRHRKRLSKTYLESLKDIQELKFSTTKKPSVNLDFEMHEMSHSPLPSINQPLIAATDDPISMKGQPVIVIGEEKEDEVQEVKSQRESVLKLEKFYESNIKLLFESVIEKIQSSRDDFEKIHEDLKSSHSLVIHMKSELDADKNRIFTYRTEWLAPCDPEFFIGLLNDYQEQIKLSDNKMEEYYPIKTFGQNNNFHIVYLKYKKVLTYSPRDFCYLKCSQCIDKEKNIWVDCSQSISNELLPEYDDIVRGNILINCYYLEEVMVNEQISCKVKFYSQVDLKVSLPVWVSKTFSVLEMKKYVQKFVERIEVRKAERKEKG